VVVTVHIHSLWDRRKAVTYTLFAGFCIAYGVTIASAGLVINDFHGKPRSLVRCDSHTPFVGV